MPDVQNSPVVLTREAPPGRRSRTIPDRAAVQYGALGSVSYSIASCREDWQAAYRLVYDAYTASGLMEPNLFRMRVTPWHLCSETDVYVAKHRGQVIYTMSVVRDGSAGLPMESIYPDEVRQRRQSALSLAEVSCLAARDGYFTQPQMFEVFVRLVALILQSCRAKEIERLLIAVHPRHFRLYRRFLGFDQISGIKTYAMVRGNPAVAGEHDFRRLDLKKYPLYDRVYEAHFERRELLGRPMPEQERDYFRPVSLFCPASSAAYAA